MKGKIVLAVILLVIASLVGMYFHYNNEEVQLRNQVEAQRGKVEGYFDTMWKIIQEKAQVSSQYKDAFEKIYPDLIAGRYSNGNGQFMQWIQEQNPNFDTSLYKDLMETIEVQRVGFLHAQERMLDLIREHKNLCQVMPGCWFIKNKTEIEYVVISSTKSKLTMETGIEDDIDLKW